MTQSASMQHCPEALMVLDEHRRKHELQWEDANGGPIGLHEVAHALNERNYRQAHLGEGADWWLTARSTDEEGDSDEDAEGESAAAPPELSVWPVGQELSVEANLLHEDWEALCASLAPYITDGAFDTEVDEAKPPSDHLRWRQARQRTLDRRAAAGGPDEDLARLKRWRTAWTASTRWHRKHFIRNRRQVSR